jgi:hypothetical protein
LSECTIWALFLALIFALISNHYQLILPVAR